MKKLLWIIQVLVIGSIIFVFEIFFNLDLWSYFLGMGILALIHLMNFLSWMVEKRKLVEKSTTILTPDQLQYIVEYVDNLEALEKLIKLFGEKNEV